MKPSITIAKDGPYLVSGRVALKQAILLRDNSIVKLQVVKRYDLLQNYALCRCGKSKNPPFCDGSHAKTGFDGTETADKRNFQQRAELISGPALDLLDDGRCCYARFCHRKHGDVWSLAEQSDRSEFRQEAIEGSGLCPAGRLVAVDKDGTLREPHLQPEIIVPEDDDLDVSLPLFVRGGIPIQSSDGEWYELRNRVALCRCGHSANKPFCDTAHIDAGFDDGEIHQYRSGPAGK